MQQLGLDVGGPVHCRTHAEYVRLSREGRLLCERTAGCEGPSAHLLGCGGWFEIDGRRVCQRCGASEIAAHLSATRVSHGGQP